MLSTAPELSTCVFNEDTGIDAGTDDGTDTGPG